MINALDLHVVYIIDVLRLLVLWRYAMLFLWFSVFCTKIEFLLHDLNWDFYFCFVGTQKFSFFFCELKVTFCYDLNWSFFVFCFLVEYCFEWISVGMFLGGDDLRGALCFSWESGWSTCVPWRRIWKNGLGRAPKFIFICDKVDYFIWFELGLFVVSLGNFFFL